MNFDNWKYGDCCIDTLKTPAIFEIAKNINELKNTDLKHVTFNLSPNASLEPLGMLLVGSVLRQFCSTFKGEVSVLSDTAHTYAGTMGFYQYAFPNCPVGKAPGESRGSDRYIPITRLSIDSIRESYRQEGHCLGDGPLIEREAGRLAQVFAGGYTNLTYLLAYLLREIMRNTLEHAEASEIWLCAQSWEKSGWAEIALLDEGIGIFRSLTKNIHHREYIHNEVDSLHWATKAGISQSFSPDKKNKSTDEWANSGFGLFMASQICKKLGGTFHLVSKNHYLSIGPSFECIDYRTGTTYSIGTSVRMRIPKRALTIGAQKIINEIRKEGEKQAKKTRSAFKKASHPSRGLMEELDIPHEIS